MKPTLPICLTFAWLVYPVPAEEPQDWRIQLLAEEGINLSELNAQQSFADTTASEKKFLEVIPKLSSEEFATRESAQKEILRMGDEVLPWLDRLPKGDDPEIAHRMKQIREELSKNLRWSKSQLVKSAVSSLLLEKSGEKNAKGNPRIFAELFCDNAHAIGKTYRHFSFEADPGLSAKVSGGVLCLAGNGRIDGDQRLVLSAKKICDEEVLPGKFRVEAMLRGLPGGEGSYHLGISVGKVRALFHPGYANGAFRFENVDSHEHFTENTGMGFTPRTDAFAVMSIDVELLPDGDTEFLATVTSGDKHPSFQTRFKAPAASIGKLDSISLDRSGRQGGDAIFDNLVVEIPPP